MRRISHFLAGFTLCAAMSFISISCQKLAPEIFNLPLVENDGQQQSATETQDSSAVTNIPDVPEVPDSSAFPPAPEPLMLDITIPVDTTILTYIGQNKALEFTVTGAEGRSDVNVTAEASGCYRQFELNLDGETGKGVLSFTLEDESASFTVLVNGPDTTFSRTIRTEAYYAVLSGIREGSVIDDDGRGGDIRIKIDSNIPDVGDVLSVVSDADWINVSYDSEGFILALQENLSGDERDAKIVVSHKDGLLSEETFHIRQDWLLYTPQGDYVTFSDKVFKAACLEIADRDGDGQVSFSEALDIREMDISGRGVKELSGLEMFRNVWKVDARDNNIEDADVLKELRQLRWLDLRGNAHLSSFDLTGCCIYFQWCRFDVNENLHYRYLLRQQGITPDNDLYSTYGEPIIDERHTQDYSHHGELHLIHKASKGDGKKAVCLTGLGYLDVDVEDGSYMRIMEDFAEAYFEVHGLDKYLDELDVYVYYYLFDNREQYVYPIGDFCSEYVKELKNGYNVHRKKIAKELYPFIFKEKNGFLFQIQFDLHPNVKIVPGRQAAPWVYEYNSNLLCTQLNPSAAMEPETIHNTGCINDSFLMVMKGLSCKADVSEMTKTIYEFFGF